MIPGRLLSTLFVIGTGLLAAQEPGSQSARDVAAALQQRYDGIRDFSADFIHTYEGGLLRTRASERGSVLIKKPGRMRWSYTEPERKLFVSDGTDLYSYIPADRQVIVSPVPPEDEASAPVLFLAGKGNLTRDFEISDADDNVGDTKALRALKLVPRHPEAEYASIVLVFDRATLQIRRLASTDHQGGISTLEFSKIRENVGLAESSFRFDIPRGVDVIRSDTSG